MAAKKLVSQTASVPAPIGGLNAKDAWANMPETDAVIMDNWFPTPSMITLRNGYTVQATFTGKCETVMAYQGLTANKLFCAVNNSGTRSIFDCTSVGAVGAAAVGGAGNTIQAVTNTRYDWGIFATSATQVLVLVNGADDMLQFDGTTWKAINSGSTPAITGVATNTFSCMAVFKQRMWFAQKNTFNVWYLPVNSIAGAATQLPLGSLFKLGGYLQTIVTVSIDNANSLNDYIAFVSSAGEVIVYEGYDPSNVQTWVLAAHFRLGRPQGNGRRAWVKSGSDAIMITADGFIAMSEALLTDRAQTRGALSDKIRNAVNADVQAYAANFGWQIILYPIGNKVIINVPFTELSVSYQYVMNTITNAWCTFGKNNSPWNAFCWETMADNLYFGANGFVAQADTGNSDNNGAILGDCAQAFSYFGAHGIVKKFNYAQPIITTQGQLTAAMDINVDFANNSPTATPSFIGQAGTPWGSPWGSPWGRSLVVNKAWLSVRGVGYSASMRVRVTATNATVQWAATNYIYEPGGLLG